MNSRRDFLLSTACLLAANAPTSAFATAEPIAAASKPLRILILGGSRFIGLHMTELALARGHSVTFFNRGRTKTDRYPLVERIKGDRNGEIDGLKGRSWDAVIDDSGYVPRQVRLTAELLAEKVPHYLFMSTVSVYPDFKTPRSEKSSVATLKDPNVEKVDETTYGPLKALCEQAVSKAYGVGATILRPGLIVGPEDNTDRFTYWPARAARGGEFIAPGRPVDKIQYIDARDLAEFAIRSIERTIYGTFNLLTAPGQVSIGALIAQCLRAAALLSSPGKPARPVWIPAKFLEAQKVQPGSEMPVWLPAAGDEKFFAATANKRALGAGLHCRSVAQTVHDTMVWHLARPAIERDSLQAGISSGRESAVLAAWHRKS